MSVEVAVSVVANPNKDFLDNARGHFLSRMSQRGTPNLSRLGHAAHQLDHVQKTITVTTISVTHNIRPPTPKVNR